MISRRSIVAAATLIMLGNVASRLLGVVREQVIASLFGTTSATSAFVAASTVPTMVYDLLIGGALTAALIPVFSDFASKDKDDELWPLVSTVMLIGGAALVVLAVILMIFAEPLMGLLASGLSSADQEQAVGMVRVVLPAVVLFGLSGVTTAVLYSRQEVVYPAFCVAGYNIGVITCAVLFAGILDTTSLVAGIVLGAALQLVLQVPGLRKIGFKFRLDFHHPALKRILLLYAPVAVGLVVSQSGVFLDRSLASMTGEDSLAVMRFATTLIQLPTGLVAMAISYAVLPALSRYAGEMLPSPSAVEDGDQEGASFSKEALRSFKGTLVMGLRLALLVMIPATVGLVILRVPLIQLLFQHGVFDANGTERTSLAFLAYAPQLPFLPVDYLLMFAFYARKNTMTPVLVGIVTVGLYVLVALTQMGTLGMVGLCLANAAQNGVHAIILFALLLWKMGGLRGFGLYSTVSKYVASSMVMGAVVYFLLPVFQSTLNMNTSIGQGITIIGGAAVGAVVYLGLAAILRVEEVVTIRRVVLARLPLG